MHAVKKAKYLEEFKILLTFDNKKEKIVDLSLHLYGEIFEPLKTLSNFKKFIVNSDTDTIEWENGADMSPDFLYKIGKDLRSAKQSPSKRITRIRRTQPAKKKLT